MKYKHKITPQIYREIVELAAKLPALQKMGKSGRPLSRVKTDFKGTENFNKEDGSYTKKWSRGTEPILVNHKIELISIYEVKGRSGIEEYVGRVRFIESVHKAKEASRQEPQNP